MPVDTVVQLCRFIVLNVALDLAFQVQSVVCVCVCVHCVSKMVTFLFFE